MRVAGKVLLQAVDGTFQLRADLFPVAACGKKCAHGMSLFDLRSRDGDICEARDAALVRCIQE